MDPGPGWTQAASEFERVAEASVTWLTPVLLLLGATGVTLAALSYRQEEVPVRGRRLLLGARLLVLLTALLLILDIRVPGTDPATTSLGAERWILIDPDLSLIVAPPEGSGTLWEEVLRRAGAEVASGARLALASATGRGPEGTDPASLELRTPDHPPGDLVEGALRLAEAGADSVVILSTLRRPPGLTDRLRDEVAVPVRLERLGGAVRNAGVSELELPRAVEEGAGVEGQLSVFAEATAPGDSIGVTLEVDGELAFAVRVAAPPVGGTATLPVSLPPPPDGSSLVRYLARVDLDGDGFPVDDERPRWVEVGEPDPGILLISARADWEPRYLLPALRSVTGLEGEGYLALGPDLFLTIEEGSEPARIVPASDVVARAGRTRLLVLHGVGGEDVERYGTLAAGSAGLLILPSDGPGATLGGVAAGNPLEGEWSVDADLPPSPLVAFLAGLTLGALPPLTAPLPISEGDPPGVALAGRRSVGGEALPLLVFRESEGRRVVVVLAQGFWRWASRDGAPRAAYRAVWGGVSDWLLSGGSGRVATGFEPVDRVIPRGEPIRWRVPGAVASVELALHALPPAPGVPWEERVEAPVLEGEPAYEGRIVPTPDGTDSTPPLPPGLYRYSATLSGTGDTPPTGPVTGVVEVEAWAPSLRLPPLELAGLLVREGPGPGSGDLALGRPLRTHPLPYLVIVVLLCAEWIGRRRAGLR